MKARKPNLLIVFPDQWRRQAVGFRGEEPVATPHIDRFAAESVDLDRAYSCAPLCSPNRSAMLTGRYPLATGVTTNCKPGLATMLGDGERTIGNLLREAGYRTGYIGKWHLDLPESSLDPKPLSGAVDWDAYVPPGPRRFGFDFWHAYNANDRHLQPHYWQDTPAKIEPNEWSTKHETDVAIRFIRESDPDEPFCLVVSWNPPHQPFEQVPDEYKALYADKALPVRPNVTGRGKEQSERHLRDYYAAVTGTDHEFGRLMAALGETGLADNTIVVLTSDHGETMGAHEWLEHKNVWYEESIGVPCFIRYPGVLKPRRESLLFNSVDLVPTLLGLLGLAVPENVQGRDCSAPLRGGDERAEDDGPKPESVYLCHYPGDVAVHRRAGREGWDVNAYGWRGVRTDRYTYVAHRRPGDAAARRYLYDHANDPYQLSPIVYEGLPSDRTASELERELRGWLRRLGDPFQG